MSPARRRSLLLAGIAVAAGGAGLLLPPLVRQYRTGAAALLGASFEDLDGRRRAMAEWRGLTLVVNFWATWCAPCVEEIPILGRFRAHHGHKGVEVVGIGIDRVDNMRLFARKMQIQYPLLVGDAGAIDLTKRLGNRVGGLPYTTALDRHGSVTHQWVGPVAPGELERVLAPILG